MFYHPKHCHDYCCSSFTKYLDDYSDDAGDALEGSIHPIFAPENFRGKVCYEAMIPSLTLASKILKSDAMVHYVTTMIDGDLLDYDHNPISVEDFRIDPDLTDGESTTRPWHADYAFVTPSSKQVGLESRARAAYVLQNLSKLITFEVIRAEDNDKRMRPNSRNPEGMCFSDYAPMPKDRLSQFKYGVLSSILLFPDSGYEELLALLTEEEEGTDEIWHKHLLLTARFSLARIILHELAHAIQGARFGMMRGFEVFFGNVPINEAGYTLEGLLFGGRVSVGHIGEGNLRPWVSLHPWPSLHLLTTYILRQFRIASLGGIPKQEPQKRILTSYIKSLFTDSFWETIYEGGMTALHPESVGEWTFEMSKVPEDWTESDPDPAIEPWRYEETLAKLGPRRTHQSYPCPNVAREDELCDAYIPLGKEADILATSIEGLVDGTLDLPVPQSPDGF